MVTHSDRPLFPFDRLSLAHDNPAQIHLDVLCAGVEDGNVHLFCAPIHLQAKVRLHIIDRKAIFVKERPGNALADLLLGCLLDGLLGNVVEGHPLVDGRGVAINALLVCVKIEVEVRVCIHCCL